MATVHNPGAPQPDIELGEMPDGGADHAEAVHRRHEHSAIQSRVFRGASLYRNELLQHAATDRQGSNLLGDLEKHAPPAQTREASMSITDAIRRGTSEDPSAAAAPPVPAPEPAAGTRVEVGQSTSKKTNSEHISLVSDARDGRTQDGRPSRPSRADLLSKHHKMLGAMPERDGMMRTNPMQNAVRFWKWLLFVLFCLGEFAFIPDPYDVGAASPGSNHTCRTVEQIGEDHVITQVTRCPTYKAFITEPFDFSSGKPYCGWENDWFLQDGALRHMEPNLCMRNWLSYGFLCVSHSMGVVLYIGLSVVMITRMRFTLSLLQTTPICEWVPFHAMQEIHNQAGYAVLYSLLTHTIFHFLRFFSNGDVDMFYSHAAISGYVGFTIMFLIVGAMVKTWPTRLLGVNFFFSLRKYKAWECKYFAHMGWILFAIIMWWHRPRFGVFWVVVLVLFIADRLLERCLMTHKVEGVELLPCGECGVMIRFPYRRKHGMGPDVEVAGSIVRISVPTLSVSQYHPFSAMYDPYDPRFACVYIARAGDWTNELHAYSKVHRSLPSAWIAGPLYSEFQSAMQFTDILLCCTGAAITPVLGLAQYYDPVATRVTLIWVTRDAELISYLMPVVNPATKIIVYFTAKKNPRAKIAQLRSQKFFAAPTLNARQKLKVEDGAAAPQARDGYVASEEGLTIVYGRPRNWDAVIDDHVPAHKSSHTCVAISTRIKRLAEEVQGICKAKNIQNIRSDASFD